MNKNSFLRLGLMTLSLLTTLSLVNAHAHDNHTPNKAATPALLEQQLSKTSKSVDLAFEQHFNESVALLKTLSQKGYLKSDVNFKLQTFTSTKSERYTDPQENQAIPNPTTGKCSFVRTLTAEGQDVYLGASDEIRPFTKMSSETEIKLARDFLTLHEAAHCDIALLNQVFLFPGNPGLEKNTHYFFKYMKTQSDNTSIYDLLNENFADAVAALELIKLNGATPEVLSVLNKIALERQDKELFDIQNGKLSSHHTHLSLLEVLTPDNLQKLNALNKASEVKDLGLQIANRATLTLLVEHSQFIRNSLNRGLASNTIVEFAALRTIYHNSSLKLKGSSILAASAVEPQAANSDVDTKTIQPQKETEFLERKESFILKKATQLSDKMIQSGLFNNYEDKQDLTPEQTVFLRKSLDSVFSLQQSKSSDVFDIVAYHQTTVDLIDYLNKLKLKNEVKNSTYPKIEGFPVYTKNTFLLQSPQDLIQQYAKREAYFKDMTASFTTPHNALVSLSASSNKIEDEAQTLKNKIGQQRNKKTALPTYSVR